MELKFLSQLSAQAVHSHTPFSGQFELTPVCNLRCHMCYVHRPEEDSSNAKHLLPVSFWLRLAKQAKEMGMLVLSLTGGETLLYPDIDELMKHLTQMGLLISFNTNGISINEERVRWFTKYVPTKINISLYGASDATYEKLCGCRDGFTRVKRAIELLQEAGLNVYLNTVLVPENIEELPKMHQYAASRKLILHTTPYIFPPRGRAGMGEDAYKRLSADKAAEAECFDKIVMYGLEQFRKSAANTVDRLEMLKQQTNFEPGFEACRAGLCSFAVNWQGFMQPCTLFDKIQVSLKDYTFKEAWEQMSLEMKQITVPKQCTECRKKDICPVCKAAIYQEGGDFNHAPQYLCNYCQELENILQRESAGIEVSVPDSRDFRHSGCSE